MDSTTAPASTTGASTTGAINRGGTSTVLSGFSAFRQPGARALSATIAISGIYFTSIGTVTAFCIAYTGPASNATFCVAP